MAAPLLQKERVLELLREAQVEHEVYEHVEVATAEAQVQALAHVEGVRVTKNLFLRDKKRRHILVTTLADAKVELKELSLRLGLGKSGLTMAAEEDLARVLGVAPGCVTPLALAHASAGARDVLALLDHRLRGQAGAAAAPAAAAAAADNASASAASAPSPSPRFFAHPAVNTSSVVLDADGLEAYLRAAGRDAARHAWADLELAAAVGRDSPGDLKIHLDAVPVPETVVAAAVAEPTAEKKAVAAAAARAAGVVVGSAKAAGKKGGGAQGGGGAAAADAAAAGEAAAARRLLELTDVRARADDLLRLASEALLGKDLAASGLEGTYALSRLRADFEAALGTLKNAAHAGGRAAARGEVVAAALGTYVK